MLLALLINCIDPVAYGAVPDDHHDDAAAFQRAIARASEVGGEVCVGAGAWDLARPPGHAGSLEITGGPVKIHGVGDRTVLRMSGPGHRRSWRGIYLRGAHGVVIRDLVIDGLDATDTEEQTHLIELGPGTHGVVISGVTFGPMRQPGQRVGEGIGGDCLRLLGEVGHEVFDVTVADSRFLDCDRSGIGLQRALHDLTFVRDTITGTGDTAIDFEPTGRGAIDAVTFVDLTIRQPAEAQSAFAITVTGTDQDLAHRVVLQRSTLEGGGVSLLDVEDVVLADNAITAHPSSRDLATISIFRHATGVRITSNTITRPIEAGPGYVIRAAHNNGVVPRGIAIEDNALEQATGHPVIGTISAGDFVVRHNTINYTADDAGSAIVQVSPDAVDVAGLTVEDNTIHGNPSAIVIASLRANRRLSGVSVRGNRAPNLAALRCNGPATAFDPVDLDAPLPDHTGCRGVAVRIRPSP